jgi:hypothetical protein
LKCDTFRPEGIGCCYGKAGHTQLLKWIKLRPGQLVIFEATGAYHRQLERALGSQSVPFVKVNPKQARRFAQASGKLAKTDRVDCEMLGKRRLHPIDILIEFGGFAVGALTCEYPS